MKRFFLFIFLLTGAFYLSSSCTTQQKRGKPLIIVSIPPYQGLVKAIVGDSLDVIPAIPKDYDPHTSEVTPHRVESLQHGTLWIGIGEAYEKKLEQALLQANPQIEMMQLTPETSLGPLSAHTQCPADFNRKDPHFWLSLKELRPQMLAITATLIRLWPQNRSLYQERLKQLLSQIDQLDRKITTELIPAQGKAVLTSHAALHYFCRDYHLIELALECHGKSPLPQDVAAIATAAKQKEALCAISFPHQSKKALDILAKQLGLPIYSIQLLDSDVLKTIEQLATDIAQSLSLQKQKS